MAFPGPASIVIRSKNDGPLIGATLKGVYNQDYPGALEVIHIDSGSTDDTVEIIKASRPAKLIQIKAEEYVPGVVLNRGMREASSPWVVFLNSDAEPAGRSWLSELLAAAESSPKAGAAFGRQTPRPDCQAVFAHDYERCFGDRRESKNWDHFFSMVSSAVRRDVWEREPFREDLQYSEDDEWSRRLAGKGWAVVYAEKSVAIHSHNYTLKQACKRAYGEAFALAALPGVSQNQYGLLRTLVTGNAREALRDLGYCARAGRVKEWPHAIAVRTAQRWGKLRGFHDGLQRYRQEDVLQTAPA